MPETSKLTLPPRPATQTVATNGSAQPPQNGAKKPNRVDLHRPRRRPVIIALGVATVAVSVVGVAGVMNAARSTQDVVVLAHDVHEGQTIAPDDLKVVHINTDAGLNVVSAGDRDQLVGKTVIANQSAGSLLNPSVLTAAAMPPKDKSIVGIMLTPDHMPGSPLVIGDIVRLVDTPREQEASPATAPTTTNAQIVAINRAEAAGQAQVTIDVLVPAAEANWVAARAATHRVAIVLDTRER